MSKIIFIIFRNASFLTTITNILSSLYHKGSFQESKRATRCTKTLAYVRRFSELEHVTSQSYDNNFTVAPKLPCSLQESLIKLTF